MFAEFFKSKLRKFVIFITMTCVTCSGSMAEQSTCRDIAYQEISTKCTKAHSNLPGATIWVFQESIQTFKYVPLPPGYTYQGTWRNGAPDGVGLYQLINSFQYAGDMRSGQPDGIGKKIFPSGKIVIGEFINGVANGNGKIIFPDQSTFQGGIRRNMPNGEGTYIDQMGNTSKGNFQQGKLFGSGTRLQFDGAEYTGYFENNELNGVGEYISPAGNIYTGNFINGKLNGDGKAVFTNGSNYQGEFENGQFAGFGSFTNSVGDIFKSNNWVDNTIIGRGEIKYNSGASYSGEIVGLTPHGNGLFSYPNGNYKVGPFKDGLLDGKGKFIERGKGNNASKVNIYEGQFANGDRHGKGTATLEFGKTRYAILNLRAQLMKDDKLTENNELSAYKGTLRVEGDWLKDTLRSGQFEYSNGDKLNAKRINYVPFSTSESELQIEGEISIKDEWFKAEGIWTRKDIFHYSLTGEASIINEDFEIYIGQLKDGFKHGIGIFRSANNSLHLPRGYIYIGSWENDVKNGRGYVIDPKSKRVQLCEYQAFSTPNCRSNSFLEWLIPIRTLFGFSDYLSPSLKLIVNRLDWSEKSYLGIPTWSFETFLQLLYSNVILNKSIDLSTDEQAKSLLKSIRSSSFKISSTPIFYSLLFDFDE